ncbi:hypothetical protein O3G_MSEX007067 [Manduca sexta]|uniref:Kazal-like domain-containing protein n=1 Tax=Manduca sexta TaxID=7130 RepID=A0A921Z4Q8_MANSE|nr:hypothetical protein O3G_MSEX007067 [Manduca sexta]
MFKNKSVIFKLWHFLRTYILTIKRFDLFLQGTLLIVILLETNVLLLLRRDATEGFNSAIIEDLVIVAGGVVECALGAILGWWGGGRRHFALSAWLAATSAAGLLVLAFPYTYSNPPNVELCGGDTISGSRPPSVIGIDDNAPARTSTLILTFILCALTQISIFAHGFTYLDDHEPHNGPYFYGILISIRLSLGLSGTNWLRASSTSDDWWEAHLSICMLTFMFAVLFTLFPKRMPQWEDEEILVDTDFLPSLGRVARNKAIILQTGALACLTISVLCFVNYDVAYVQARFNIEGIRQDPRTSRTLTDVFRSFVIIFFIMIFRVRFSVWRRDGVKANTASRVGGVVCIFVAVFFIVLAALSCDVAEIEGFEQSGYIQPACSAQCGCSSERYGFSPVCGLDSSTTFFSPCNAGCSELEDLNGFIVYNCTCGAQRAVRGACALDSCRLVFGVYQIFYTLILAVSGSYYIISYKHIYI